MQALFLSAIGLTSLSSAPAAPSVGCPSGDPVTSLLAVHEQARKAHLDGNADLIEASSAEQVVMASRGDLNMTTSKEIGNFFRRYLGQVRYLEWSDMKPPIAKVSADGKHGWMAVQVKARYVETAKPEAGEKSFKSSWISTYQRIGCDWKMIGMSSAVADL